MFLGQGNPNLKRLYKTSGLRMYRRMNKHLREVGDVYRATGVFG
jgi:hypothetical protein